MPQNYTSIQHLLPKKTYPTDKHTIVSSSTPGTGQSTSNISLPKEAGPSRTMVEATPIQDVQVVRESVEHEKIAEDVKPFIDVKLQNMKVSDDLKKLGLQPIEKTKYEDYKNIKLPLTDDRIALGLQAPISSSLRWLATFALFLLQQSHLTLKIIHGKAVRVIKK